MHSGPWRPLGKCPAAWAAQGTSSVRPPSKRSKSRTAVTCGCHPTRPYPEDDSPTFTPLSLCTLDQASNAAQQPQESYSQMRKQSLRKVK